MKGTIIFDLEGTLVDVGSIDVANVFISRETLEDLHKKYLLAIVTGANRDELTYVLKYTYLGAFFDEAYTMTSSEVPEKKETGVPFEALLRKELPRPMVALGDSLGDRLGCEKNGIPFVSVRTADLMRGASHMDSYIKEALRLLHG
jgi:phosphoglycolate phosphatase-like HAD superfamily hydrolase